MVPVGSHVLQQRRHLRQEPCAVASLVESVRGWTARSVPIATRSATW